MISISRDGSKLVVVLEHGLSQHDGSRALRLDWDARTDLLAEALTVAVRRHVHETIEAVRRLEYEAGWKDAKSHKRPKRTWFASTLRTVVP